MICKNCHAEPADGSTVCEQCGCDLCEPMPVAEPVSVETNPNAVPTEANFYATPVEPNPYAAAVTTPYPSAAPKKKKKGLIIGLIAAAAVIIAVVAVVIYLGGADGRTVEKAQSLAGDGEYLEALDLLDSIEDPSSDVKQDIKTLKNEIYEGIENEVKSLLDDGSPKDALEYLNEYNFIPNYDKVLENIYEGMENEIFALMDEGEYIKAQELLDAYDFLPSHETLAAQIKYESFILFSAFDLRPLMKNPSSLQINTVEFYDDGEIYPTIVINDSGQNGFGGYSTSYVLFFGDDLNYTGSTTTLDISETEYESLEYYTASIIFMYRKIDDYAVTDAVYDLARINSFLPSGNMPNIDITQYARQSAETGV